MLDTPWREERVTLFNWGEEKGGSRVWQCPFPQCTSLIIPTWGTVPHQRNRAKVGEWYHGESCFRYQGINYVSKQRTVAAWSSPPVEDRVRSPGEVKLDGTLKSRDHLQWTCSPTHLGPRYNSVSPSGGQLTCLVFPKAN